LKTVEPVMASSTDTAKVRVLKKFPKAEAEFFAAAFGYPDLWDIYQSDDVGATCLGSGKTEDEAWADAARIA
jgi:hypothetical protein